MLKTVHGKTGGRKQGARSAIVGGSREAPCHFVHADGSHGLMVMGVGFSTVLCVCFSARYLKKSMQLGSPNLIQKCSTISPGNPSILGSEDQRLRSQKSR